MRNQVGGRRKTAQFAKPALLRLVEQRLAAGIEKVEPEGSERQFAPGAFQVELAAEAAHGDLKRLRTAVAGKAEHLAFENEVASRQGARGFHHFRHGRRNVVEGAEEHHHVAAGTVHLDARAIELEFERRLAQIGERRFHALRGLRQHGLNRAEDFHAAAIEPGRSRLPQQARHRSDVAGQHRGAAHPAGIGAESLRQSFQHDAFERALPQFAQEQTEQEFLLGPRGARHQRAQHLASALLGARAFDGRDLLDGSLHFADFQSCDLRWSRGGFAQRRETDSRALARQAAGKIGHHGFHLAGVNLA